MTTFGGALGGDPLGGQALGQTRPVQRQTNYVRSFAVGTTTWVCPQSGTYRFILKGAGAQSDSNGGGGSGAHCEYGRVCRPSEVVTVSVGTAVTATFEDGHVASAGGAGAPPAGGTASGGDVNLNGSAGGVGGSATGANGLGAGGGAGGTGIGFGGGGAGAPGTAEFPGGNGGSGGAPPGTWPGAGGGSSAGANGAGAAGMALVYRI